jgi:hypothetical protein
MARLQQPNTEIAKYMGISVDTLTNHFSDILSRARIDGDNEILEAQMSHAIGGNAPLLIHLGKYRLKQNESQSQTASQCMAEQLFTKWEAESKIEADEP